MCFIILWGTSLLVDIRTLWDLGGYFLGCYQWASMPNCPCCSGLGNSDTHFTMLNFPCTPPTTPPYDDHNYMIIWWIIRRCYIVVQVFAVTSFLFVLASITGFCLETHPSMYEKLSVNRTCGSSAIKPTVIYQHKPFLHVLDYVCTIFFTAELLLRVTVTPSKRRFFRSPMNLIDILALLPLYVQIGLKVEILFLNKKQ